MHFHSSAGARLVLTLPAFAVGWLIPFALHAEPVPSPLRQVIVVFKTHFDIGYTDMASNVVQRYRTTMIDQALGGTVAVQSRRFTARLDGWAPASFMIVE